MPVTRSGHSECYYGTLLACMRTQVEVAVRNWDAEETLIGKLLIACCVKSVSFIAL